jgi:hypothetical protein
MATQTIEDCRFTQCSVRARREAHKDQLPANRADQWSCMAAAGDLRRCYPRFVPGEYTPDTCEILERQRAYFASDDCLRERADLWRDATPEECWAATLESCREVEWLFALVDTDTRSRAEQPEPIPAAVIAILEALQR